jgi:hypothetical protein
MLSILLIGIILLILLIYNAPAKIDEDEIYPKGNITNSKIFDSSNNEIPISITQGDVNYIIQTIKKSTKELEHGYESGMIEINITLTDSTIQILVKDSETVYYVFHNKTYNAVCYEVQSKELCSYLERITAKAL